MKLFLLIIVVTFVINLVWSVGCEFARYQSILILSSCGRMKTGSDLPEQIKKTKEIAPRFLTVFLKRYWLTKYFFRKETSL